MSYIITIKGNDERNVEQDIEFVKKEIEGGYYGGYFGNDGEWDYKVEPEVKVYDKNDYLIEVGDNVIWHDPETDNESSYEVYEIREDMVKLTSEHGECEALPQECEIIFN